MTKQESNQELVVEKDKPVVVQPVSDSSTMLTMIGQMAANPDVDIDKVERLMALQVGMQEKENEAAFYQALSVTESEMGVILKDKYNKQTQSTYSDLGTIISTITPVYTKHGISLSFDSGKEEDGIVPVICYVSACGHTKRYTYYSPITDKGIKGTVMMTPAHARGSAIAYGRRYLTCMIFNLATADDDGNAATPQQIEKITPEQAVTLHGMLEKHGMKEGRLVKWFNASAKTNVSRLEDMEINWYEHAVHAIKKAS